MRAFHLYPGVSDEWVTGYVGVALAELGRAGHPAAANAAREAWRSLIQAQRPDGRWGVHARTIGDADSTLWVMRLATGVGIDPGDAARHAVREHQRADGSVSTYAAAEPIRTIIEAPPDAPFPVGSAHAAYPVATGVPVVATGARAFLAATQSPAGSGAPTGGWRTSTSPPSP